MNAQRRFFSQPSAISSHATYILDSTVSCECGGDGRGPHTSHPAYGNCPKIVQVIDSRATAKALAHWNAV